MMFDRLPEVSSPVHGASAELIGEVSRRDGGVDSFTAKR